MANVTIDDLTSKATPAGTDQVELQETSAGASKKTTLAAIITALVNGVYQFRQS